MLQRTKRKGRNAHCQIDPRTHQDRATREGVSLVAQVHHRRQHKSTSSTIPSKYLFTRGQLPDLRATTAKAADDVFGRDLQVDGEAHVGRNRVVKLTRESSLGCETVVDSCEGGSEQGPLRRRGERRQTEDSRLGVARDGNGQEAVRFCAHHIICSCEREPSARIPLERRKDAPPCRYRITRSLPTALFIAKSFCIRFHNRLLITHSPVTSLLPSSAASASARNPRRPRFLTRNEMGVTMPSLGVGRRDPRSRTDLYEAIDQREKG